MRPMGMIPLMNYQQRNEELIKQADNHRLLEQAFETEQPSKSNASKILALLGRELSALGFSLEIRYGGQQETRPTFTSKATEAAARKE